MRGKGFHLSRLYLGVEFQRNTSKTDRQIPRAHFSVLHYRPGIFSIVVEGIFIAIWLSLQDLSIRVVIQRPVWTRN